MDNEMSEISGFELWHLQNGDGNFLYIYFIFYFFLFIYFFFIIFFFIIIIFYI